MSLTTRLFCLLLIHLPGYPTRLEADLLVRLDLNAAVWRVAIEQGLVKAWDCPGWGLASTDPQAEVPAGWTLEDGRVVRRYRALTHRELSAQTLYAIRRQVEWNR